MLPGAVIGATFRPGFSGDLSSWRLVIDDEGNLFQDTMVWQSMFEERRQEHIHIGTDAVLELLLEAERFGFRSCKEFLRATMEDQSSRSLTIRFGEMDATVEVYGADLLAHEGNLKTIRFLSLWTMIHRYAPFPRRP